MRYVVSLSGGIASAIAADKVIERYGRDNVTLWFADTSWEDDDLHRFMTDCMVRWGGSLVRYCDGRTPLELAEDERIIPNNMLAPCSRKLKIEPFVRYIEEFPKPVTVVLGLKWTEQHRMDGPKNRYEQIPGVSVDYPWLWRPFDLRGEFAIIAEWGIAPPRLYGLGFEHNNCGGRCVKQGRAAWENLRATFPARFSEVADWESRQRTKLGDHSILRVGNPKRPLPLEQLSGDSTENTPVSEDKFGCFCASA